MSEAYIENILARSYVARADLAQDRIVGPFVDQTLSIPKPYLCKSGQVRLVIIGQDPTVDNEASRQHIKTVLNLDKRGSLRTFLADLCQRLGVSLDENVYATNACKNFFTARPTQIKTIDVLEASAPVWLPILRDELAQFPDAAVISLGQPVLPMLVHLGARRAMKYYWGYDPRWKAGRRKPICMITAEESTVGRQIFPFIHQPSLRGTRTEFYRVRMNEYIDFVRTHSSLGGS